MIDLDKLLELEEKATQGIHFLNVLNKDKHTPTEVNVSVSQPWTDTVKDDYENLICTDSCYGEKSLEENDARLFVEMRNSIKELCLELKALREVEKAARIFIMFGHPLPSGVCISDHYINKLCNCGFTGLEKEIAKLDEARRS
jgi:hypothetical protein